MRTRNLAILTVLLVAIIATVVAVGLSVRSTVRSVPTLFQRNAELKAQGYYMAEFEFKMVSVVHYLNEGRYLAAYLALRRIGNEMAAPERLVRMPGDASPEQLRAFLLERQDPTTGAFMDPRYPVFSYVGPTANVIDALDDLSQQTGRPLVLTYPLRFLDELQRPAQLRAYLDGLLYLDERWAALGGPGPYGPGVSELPSLAESLERLDLYRFSEAWHDALRQWLYETQDTATGYWGARIGTPEDWRQAPDANSTYHVIKHFVDEWGNDRHAAYPLRYGDALARSILAALAAPVSDDPVAAHAWGLNQAQGAQLITRRLWLHLSAEEQAQVRAAVGDWLAERYRLYRPAEGGFAIYTGSVQTDLDGTSTALMLLQAAGSLPGTPERQRLWGDAIASAPGWVRRDLAQWADAVLPAARAVNSVRVYKNAAPAPDAYDDGALVQILYPGETRILDVMELRRHLAAFIEAQGEALGNWVSAASLRDKPLDLRRPVRPVPIAQGALALDRLAAQHPDAQRFYVVGYDAMQVPVFRVAYVQASGR